MLRLLVVVMMVVLLLLMVVMIVAVGGGVLMKKVIAAVVVDVSITIIQTIMLLFVIGRSMQACLAHSLCRRLLEYFNVEVVDINIEIVILEFTIFKFSHQTVRAFVFTESTCNLIGIHPECKFNWQL